MGVRVDQLLHWLCLAKSRSLVTRACRTGHVRVNGQPVRPAKEVRAGDRILFDEAPRRRRREIELLEVPSRQVSRKQAPTYYRTLRDERPDSVDGEIASS